MGKKKHVGHNRGHRGQNPAHTLSGRLSVNRRGFGFVSTDAGDFYIARRDMNGAFNGDTVDIRRSATSAQGMAAKIVRVTQRATPVIVGRFEQAGTLGVVSPRDPRILYDGFVDPAHFNGALPGDWVKATVLTYPSRSSSLELVVSEVIRTPQPPLQSSPSDSSELSERPRAAFIPEEVLIAEHNLPVDFATSTLKQAEAFTLDVEKTLAADPQRRDIRDRYIFTIDPVDARDFDDAISIESLEGGRYKLGVHIADVAHYVSWDSPLDCEARTRTTSVYLPTRVIPMLPERLSNDLCSLRPGEDRLAFSVDMVVDTDGQVISSDIYRSVIQSHDRYSYDEVSEQLEGGQEYRNHEAHIALSDFATCAKALHDWRRARGGLEFETPDPKIHCDEYGIPYEIVMRTKNRATDMIEEAMIAANETVASYLHARKRPCVYRVHEEPEANALDGIEATLRDYGYGLPADADVSSKTFQKILRASAGTPQEYAVSSLLLRTLKQAYYDPEPKGHFGLASKYYAHFTSPIRRYPDVMVHRLLAATLRGEDPAESEQGIVDELGALCVSCSEGERRAESASREAVKFKICEFMSAHVGETFAGIITNVTHFGLFVTLENSADGLVHLKKLPPDTWSFSPGKQTLKGENSKRTFHLGQPVEVRLVQIDAQEGLMDFELVKESV